MKEKFNLIIGIFASIEVIYKLVTCANCEDQIFGFEMPGIVYILIWTIISIVLLYRVYAANWGKKEEANN